MNDTMSGSADHKTEMIIGSLLKAGVVTAASVVFIGGVIYIFRHGLEPADYAVFNREPQELCNVRGIIGSAFSGHGRGFIQLGLLLLIATPVARVALSIFAFARQRDRLYVFITLFVFCILLYSLFSK